LESITYASPVPECVPYKASMLSIYRRHVAGCKNRSRRQRNWRCPIWVAGTLYGEATKKSFDLSNWEASVRLVREWEIGKPSATVHHR